MKIHHVQNSSQPHVQILCTGEWLYVWGDAKELPANVYDADGGVLYTFERDSVSCEACKKAQGEK